MGRRAWSILPALLVLLAVALPMILRGFDRGRGYADQFNYHMRVVEAFAAQWPRADLTDYVSATTPLYHLMQAALWRHVTTEVMHLQVVGMVITLGLLAVVWWYVSKSAGALGSAVLVLPLACSMYVIDSGIWVLPDNMAWVFVAWVVGMSFTSRVTPRMLALGGVALALLVLTRQSHLWAAGVLWAAAWLARESREPAAAGGAVFSRVPSRLKPTLIAVAATLPAFAIVAWFWHTWGGRLTPPVFDAWYTRRFNPTAPAFLLSLLGVYSVFFAGFLLPALTRLIRQRPVILGLAVAAGAAAALAPVTTYDLEQGRYGGIWNIARKLPMVADRSVFILALSVAGAVAAACWGAALDFRRRWIFLGVLTANIAAQCLNPWVYQRYTEPFFLMLLALAASAVAIPAIEPARAAGEPGAPSTALEAVASPRRKILIVLRLAGPAGLAALLLAVTILSYRGARPVVPLPPGAVEAPPTNAAV